MLLTMILIWILLEREEDQSEAHWIVVTGISMIIIAMLLIEYVLRKMTKNNSRRFLYEIVFLAILLVLWFCFIGIHD